MTKYCNSVFFFISCIFRPWLYHLLLSWKVTLLHGKWPGEELAALCSNSPALLCHDDCPVTYVWLQTSLARWAMEMPFFYFFFSSLVFVWFFFSLNHELQHDSMLDFPCSWIDDEGFNVWKYCRGPLPFRIFIHTMYIIILIYKSTSVGFLHHHSLQIYIGAIAILDGSSCRLDLARQSSSVMWPSPCLLLFQVPARYLLGTWVIANMWLHVH